MNVVVNNLASIIGRLRRAACDVGRDATSVRLVAVSKFHPSEAVQVALAADHRVFGENRVQEAKAKFLPLRKHYPDIELHLIGPLQTNKAEDAVKIFDVIETLDRPQLAKALAEAMHRSGRQVPCYVEINIGEEPQKAGIQSEALPSFLKLCRQEYGLMIIGLMCIPPQGQDPRPYFARLKQLADAHQLPHVSMGMSGDFEVAIEEGATEVRIGTALFGERVTP
jgi:pyridoxal phosphate enzyme (YggS family)